MSPETCGAAGPYDPEALDGNCTPGPRRKPWGAAGPAPSRVCLQGRHPSGLFRGRGQIPSAILGPAPIPGAGRLARHPTIHGIPRRSRYIARGPGNASGISIARIPWTEADGRPGPPGSASPGPAPPAEGTRTNEVARPPIICPRTRVPRNPAAMGSMCGSATPRHPRSAFGAPTPRRSCFRTWSDGAPLAIGGRRPHLPCGLAPPCKSATGGPSPEFVTASPFVPMGDARFSSGPPAQLPGSGPGPYREARG